MIQLPSNLAQLRAAWRVTNDIEQRSTPCFRLVNAATPKLYVYDVIGGYDLDASDFVQTVHSLDAKTIDLHINSPGGLVYDGVAMYEALKEHPATVTGYVDGLAASAASFLLQAADHRVMGTGSRAMIHDAQVAAWGSPADLREAADLGEAVSNDIAGIYAGRAGGKPAAWRSAMSATTWYSAQQTVDVGLADRVAGSNDGPDNRTRLIQARFRALATQGG